ncbi:ATP-binding protein [Kitasatospora sp. NPDC058406]|uniref:ATP-binding protein n=1 Tax=Kitasatospora sp. NPDC058406 TaxID=3346483 RepID=UPI003654C2CE
MQHTLMETHAPSGPEPILDSAAAEILLPYLPESAGQARRFLRETLTKWALDQLLDTAELVASELVANAAKTGCRQQMAVTVRVISRTTVRISVRDGSCALPVLIQAAPDEECHRGLTLVNRLTRGRWGVSVEALGKVVHADLSIPR